MRALFLIALFLIHSKAFSFESPQYESDDFRTAIVRFLEKSVSAENIVLEHNLR